MHWKEGNVISRAAFASVVLISNALIWYSFAFSILTSIIHEASTVMWITHFGAAIFSAIVGATVIDDTCNRTTFLTYWMLIGIISSFVRVFVNVTSTLDVLIISFLFGVSFGLGLPASMGYFADCTHIENRAKLGGIILCINGLGAFLLGIIAVDDIMLQTLTLAIWRIGGLMIFLVISPSKENREKCRSISYASIISQRSFILYFIPWVMFSLIAYLGLPVQLNILEPGLVNLFSIIESALAGVVAIVGGFLSDTIGRKRIAITGFILLGLGYAILGIYPESLVSWYFYTLVDGIAWGIFYLVFIMTIWADLSPGSSSDKYYALGGLPYFVSNFLRLMIGSYIAENVSAYAIFSLTAFFLFLAVIPLFYAPETLPEKKIRDRELKNYIEKAKKVKEKFT